MYKKTGTIQITDDLELKDFTWWIDWENDVVMIFNLGSMTLKIEVFMKMDGGAVTYSRMIPISIPSEVSQSVIMTSILSLDQFKDSEAL